MLVDWGGLCRLRSLHVQHTLLAHAVNRFIQGIDLGQEFGEEKAMVRLKDPYQGLFQFRTFGP